MYILFCYCKNIMNNYSASISNSAFWMKLVLGLTVLLFIFIWTRHCYCSSVLCISVILFDATYPQHKKDNLESPHYHILDFFQLSLPIYISEKKINIRSHFFRNYFLFPLQFLSDTFCEIGPEGEKCRRGSKGRSRRRKKKQNGGKTTWISYVLLTQPDTMYFPSQIIKHKEALVLLMNP